MTPVTDLTIILAAGGVLSRETLDGAQVLVVHRKRHDDWTLPKGKRGAGESLQEAALREVREESGCVAELGDYAGAIAYEVDEIPKVVFFWRMKVVAERPFTDHEEVDRVEWVSPAAAQERLTHGQERSLVANLCHGPIRPYHSPENPPLEPQTSEGRWSWSRGKRAHARLQREFEAFRVELAYREQRSRQADNAWAAAARDQLTNVKRYVDANDIEGGWHCLHAARRLAVFGLSMAELEDQGRLLKAESAKLSSWRAAAIKDLVTAPPLTAERMYAAMEVRDEYSGNQYHMIWLTADQLGVLLWVSLSALVLFMISLAILPVKPTTWDYRLLFTVLLTGILGAAFSTAQALISNANPTRVPERVAGRFVIIIRSLFGATAGLAGYVFLKSKLLPITIDGDGTGAALAIAFLFGYTGERLITRVAESVSKGRDHA